MEKENKDNLKLQNEQRKQVESLLLQVSDMINKIQTKKVVIPDDLSSQVMQEIDRLEEAIAIFQDITSEDLKEADIDIVNLRTTVINSVDTAEKDKKLFEKAAAIEREAVVVKSQILKALEKADLANKNAKKATTKGIKDRRNRFKPLGGNKNWIPL